jgi:hypothetical protein
MLYAGVDTRKKNSRVVVPNSHGARVAQGTHRIHKVLFVISLANSMSKLKL